MGAEGVQTQTWLPGATGTDFWRGADIPLVRLPEAMVKDAKELIGTALPSFDRCERVTTPSLPYVADWKEVDAGRRAMRPAMSHANAAARGSSPCVRVAPSPADHGGNMIAPLPPPCPEHDAMRERLEKGTLQESLRAHPPAGITIRGDAELGQSLHVALRHHEPAQDLHVFAYGSLMWNPVLGLAHSQVALVQGWPAASACAC